MVFRFSLVFLLCLRLLHASGRPWSSVTRSGLHRHGTIRRSFQQVRSGCAGLRSAGLWRRHRGKNILELKEACSWVERLQRGDADIDSDFLVQQQPRDLSEEPNIVEEDETLVWFADSSSPHYPLFSFCLFSLICLIIAFIWEEYWLGSTMFGFRARCKDKCKRSKPETATLEDDSLEASGVISQSKLWDDVEEICKRNTQCEPASQEQTMLRFTHRLFYAHSNDGVAIVWVERVGSCDGEVKVKASTQERADSNFAAKANTNFEPTEVDVVFRPGERFASFEIPIMTTVLWESTRWFRVELGEITGNACLYPQRYTRIFVIHDALYPCNVPAKVFEMKYMGTKKILLGYYFMKECAILRGQKFWKTFLALIYEPIHKVVVVNLVQKFIISFAVNRDLWSDTHNGAAMDILILACIHFASSCICRWADIVQTKNRGRTGGIRQTHRLYLLDKMLIIGHQQQMQYRGIHWLYAAIHDVDSVTMDIYWQFFMAVQAAESLTLQFLLLTLWDYSHRKSQGRTFNPERLAPAGLFLIILPLTSILIWRRRRSTKQHIMHRKDHEADWMNVFSWLADVGHYMYGFGYRELAAVEGMWKKDNKDFVKDHQIARDTMNDSVAIAVWLTDVAYLIIVIWGGWGVLEGLYNDDKTSVMEVGQYVLLLNLFSNYGKYITKLHHCVVNFQRGSVSLTRIQKYLNMPFEGRIMADVKKSQSDDENAAPEESILLKSVCLHIKHKRFGIGPFGSAFMKTGTEIRFPLGRIVCVQSQHEGRLLAILAMAAGVITPSAGKVLYPTYVWRIMLPTQPVHLVGELTCQEELMSVGLPPKYAEHTEVLLRVFEIDPQQGSRHLPPGKVQVLSLLRALLRDPEVLVLSNPMAFASEHLQQKAFTLLRAWQKGGGLDGLLQCGLDAKEETTPTAAAGPSKPSKQRTIIAAFNDKRHYASADLVIDIDEFWDEAREKEFRNAAEDSEDDSDIELDMFAPSMESVKNMITCANYASTSKREWT